MAILEQTLCLLKKDSKLLLALGKKGFNAGKYNGVGGKIRKNETPDQAMVRKVKEEIGVTPTSYGKVGYLEFDEYYEGEKRRIAMHLYIASEWDGDPMETNMFIPHWFHISDSPYEKMFPDDKYWLPLILKGKKIRAYFDYDKDWNVLYKDIYNMNQNVSVVIDGQAGSCGKGKICGYLSQIDQYKISTNNWSSNAGHTYVDNKGRKIVVSHLPMAIVNPDTIICINAGAIITPEILFKEIKEYKDLLGKRKVYVHPRAMVIQQKHRDYEMASIRSGSTFKGCGAALADKIMRKKDIILAKDYFSNVHNSKIEIMDTAMLLNNEIGKILVEGAQGQDLDINYGLDYPNVTSRMCSAAQIIADAGLSVFGVKDIYMIIRPYPIRISNETNIGKTINSGDYAGSQEITWEEVAKRSGFKGNFEEYTTVTKKKRRVFEMNWDRLKYNVMINKPTQIVLNFAQYIDYRAYNCKDYAKLPKKVKDFIKRIEEETGVPVTIIGTGENEEDIIDLRKLKLNT